MTYFKKDVNIQVLQTKAVEITAEYSISITDKTLTVTRKMTEKHKPILEGEEGAEFTGPETIILNEDLEALFNEYCMKLVEESINKDLPVVADKINRDLSEAMVGTANIIPVTLQDPEPQPEPEPEPAGDGEPLEPENPTIIEGL